MTLFSACSFQFYTRTLSAGNDSMSVWYHQSVLITSIKYLTIENCMERNDFLKRKSLHSNQVRFISKVTLSAFNYLVCTFLYMYTRSKKETIYGVTYGTMHKT